MLRYLSIYGLRRTLYKIAGRRRGSLRWLRPRPARRRDIAVLGCGQYAFATIGCIVARHAGVTRGEVATYIPELAHADPAAFGIAVVTVDGEVAPGTRVR